MAQLTPIPRVPIETPMFDEQGNLTRTWIIFFEKRFKGSTPRRRVYNWELGVTQNIAVGTGLTGRLTVQDESSWVAVRWSITAETAPVGASIIVDLLLYVGPAAAASIFPAGNANKIVLPAGSLGPVEGTAFLTTPLSMTHPNTLAPQVIQVGSTTPGRKVHIELVVDPA